MISYLAIFDVDNTLISLDESIDFDGLLIRAFQEMHVEIPSQMKRDTLWRAGKDHANLLKEWGVDDPRQFWEIFDRLDFDARSEAVKAKKIVLFPDALATLASLKESRFVRLAVHTNSPSILARFQLEHFGLIQFFDYVLALDVAGYDQSRAKPEPWGIQHIQSVMKRKFNTEFSRATVFVGDSEIDMLAASNAGIPGIKIAREAVSKKESKAFDVVTSLSCITPLYIDGILRHFHGQIYEGKKRKRV
nr:HAD hydrolase-like protein [Candidatus Sigynarchaeota archaeon]